MSVQDTIAEEGMCLIQIKL